MYFGLSRTKRHQIQYKLCNLLSETEYQFKIAKYPKKETEFEKEGTYFHEIQNVQ